MATKPSDFITSMTWGDDPSDKFRELRLNLRVNQKARVAVLDSVISKAAVHYGKYYYYCIGEGCPACEIKEPAARYLTWVFLYNLDNSGQPVQPVSGVIKTWLYGRDKYSVLSGLKSEWSDLRIIDLILECTDEKYQRFSIVPARECVWQKDPVNAHKIIEAYKAAKVDPIDLMARVLTLAQIQTVVRGAPPPEFMTTTGTDQGATGVYPPTQTTAPTSVATLQSLLESLQR